MNDAWFLIHSMGVKFCHLYRTDARHGGSGSNLLIGRKNGMAARGGSFTMDQFEMLYGSREMLLDIGHIQRGKRIVVLRKNGLMCIQSGYIMSGYICLFVSNAGCVVGSVSDVFGPPQNVTKPSGFQHDPSLAG